MKIVTIEGTMSPPDFEIDPLTPELQAAVDEADVVLYFFSPHAVQILKGPSGLKVYEARYRWPGVGGEQWVMLEGSADHAFCESQHTRLIPRSEG